MNDGRKGAVTVLAGAGIVGPVGFVLVVVVQGVLQPAYSHVTMPVSALAAEPSGWVQNANFMGLGLLLIAHAIGLHLGVRRSRWGILGPLLLAVSGLCIVGAGIFPATDVSGAFSPRPIHSAVSVLAFLSAGFGMIALSRRLTRDPAWRGYSSYVLSFGVAVLLLLVSFGGLAVSPEAPLHEWMGIAQRGLIGTWLAGILFLAYRLLHIGRGAE